MHRPKRLSLPSVLVRLKPVGTLTDYVFSVIVAFDQDGRLVLCRHKDRTTWETPGGHIEPGESPREAAEREFCEETGAVATELIAIADYDVDGIAGRLYTAEARSHSQLSGFEIAETIATDELPDELTYPDIAPILVRAARDWRSGCVGALRPRNRPD